MERCYRCKIDENKAMLFDAIYEGRSGLLCERCALIENIPIISRPKEAQIKESRQAPGVYERMRRMSGMPEEVRSMSNISREQRLKEIDGKKSLLPERTKLELVDYFHWEIMRNRRRKGLSQKQLAEVINVPEIAIEMLEKARIPDNAEEIIRRLENFLQIRLKKITTKEVIERMNITHKPVLVDQKGRELDHIPEPEITKNKEDLEEGFKEDLIKRAEDLDIRSVDTNDLKIRDLREIHKRRIEVSKQEKKEEQRRIEERQSLIEARKEELRLMKERESKELDNMFGGKELLDKKEY